MKLKEAKPALEDDVVDKEELKEFKNENLERYHRCEMDSRHA